MFMKSKQKTKTKKKIKSQNKIDVFFYYLRYIGLFNSELFSVVIFEEMSKEVNGAKKIYQNVDVF